MMLADIQEKYLQLNHGGVGGGLKLEVGMKRSSLVIPFN